MTSHEVHKALRSIKAAHAPKLPYKSPQVIEYCLGCRTRKTVSIRGYCLGCTIERERFKREVAAELFARMRSSISTETDGH